MFAGYCRQLQVLRVAVHLVGKLAAAAENTSARAAAGAHRRDEANTTTGLVLLPRDDEWRVLCVRYHLLLVAR